MEMNFNALIIYAEFTWQIVVANIATFLPKTINLISRPLVIINQTTIRQTENKIFRTDIDLNITWKGHIQNVVSKLSSGCFLIRQQRSSESQVHFIL